MSEMTVVVVETVTEVVEVATPGTQGPPGEGVPAGGTTGQALVKASDDDFDTEWGAGGGGGGAPTDADYLVGTANGTLSAEIVVGTTPGGELGGTWASPTVDATHSGSSHAAVQAAAEATAAAALSAHEADTTNVHGLADTSAVMLEGDAAGGVLAGTYPNPSFASDMATQAELDAHINDAADAHDASAISILDTAGDFTATDVEGALAELQSDHETDAQNLADHIADTTDAHDASAVSVDSTNLSGVATDVQASLEELDNLLDDHSARHEEGGADVLAITAGIVDSEAATDGQVLTADGAGSAAWETPAGGGSGEALQRDITQATHGLAVGDVVMFNGTSWAKAQADSAANAEVVGIVAAVDGTDDFTLHYGGRITGLSGLTAGEVFYLDDDTAGLLTTTEPADTGDISKPLLIADSTTTGFFFNWRGAAVAAASGSADPEDENLIVAMEVFA